jgi:hypothetical protein
VRWRAFWELELVLGPTRRVEVVVRHAAWYAVWTGETIQ